ncbi:MAG TPA: M20/M25/M40 family metallo-hydrolase [Candidatus Magasanikbacteria bacterium]|nr:M20/M25/M40 family metallo-hydrolase [Candidatus Magasanikbacteria bacterium]
MPKINKRRLVKLFCDLAKIKSPSGKEEEISRFIEKELGTIGISARRDRYGNLIASLAGWGEPLILCAHMDTVSIGPGEAIRPVVGGKTIKSDGTTILGADNKDSAAAILEMLRLLKEAGQKHRALELVFTRDEEAISKGASNLDFSLLRGRECVISDHCAKYGVIVQSAPFNFQFQVKVVGKRAHVKAPEEGINSIKIVAQAIAKMPLGRVDEKTTANIAFQVGGLQGVVDDGDRGIGTLGVEIRNSVPDLAVVYGEVRGIDRARVGKTLKKIESDFQQVADRFGGKSIFTVRELVPGYSFNKNNRLIKEIGSIFKAQGVKSELVSAVGGSDANVFNNRGLTAVVISSASRLNHQLSEYVIISDLVRLVDFYWRLVTGV